MRGRRGARRAGGAARDRAGGARTSRASPRARSRSTSTSTVAPGVSVEQRVEPLARVGCYVPGGRFPLPSSLLMTAVPARVAGVREIIAVCPRPEPAVMAAALEAGVTRLFRIGGAHAVAALAYGTATRAARRQDRRPRQPLRRRGEGAGRAPTARSTSTPARPRSSSSPAAAGRTGSPRISIAQAEHDPDARAIFITWSRRLADAGRRGRRPRAAPGATIVAAVARRARRRHRRARSPTRRWRWPTASRRSTWSSIAKRWRKRPLTAGAVFVGPYTAQAAGDYATGSNHVLPTAGAARFRGGLSRRRLRARDVGAAAHARRARAARADDRAAGARRRARRARRVDRGARCR